MWLTGYYFCTCFFLFFFILGLTILFFKFDRAIFVLISFEFMVLGLFFMLAISGATFLAVYFLFVSVLSSVASLTCLVSMVNTYGNDNCYY